MENQEPLQFDGCADFCDLPDFSAGRVSAQEFATAMEPIIIIAAQIFADSLNNDEIWREWARIHGRFRTWWLRWRLRHHLLI